jgi:hypothetical protein
MKNYKIMNIRDEIVDAVLKEIVGPDPKPKYKDKTTGEEILLASVHGSPKSRYGAGMLYPQQAINNEIEYPGEGQEETKEEPDINEDHADDLIKSERSNNGAGDEKDEEPVGMANQYLPSAMGFTVRFKRQDDDEIKLLIRSAFYNKGKDKKPTKELKDGKIVAYTNKDGKTYDSDYWTRQPIKPDLLSLKLNSLIPQDKKSYYKVINKSTDGSDWLVLRVFDRTTSIDREENLLTYTFVLINALHSVTDDSTNPNKILYQNELTLTTDSTSLIEPYKEKELRSDTNEEKELNLLYRNKRVYSIGHGTSVEWKVEENNTSIYEIVKQIKTSVIPVYDLPQVAPTAKVSLSMLELSDIGDWEKAKESLKILKKRYEAWIEGQDTLTDTDEFKNYREAAKSNIEKCNISLSRIDKGIDLLLKADLDSDLVKCFRWMNRSMIWQQQRSKAKIRKWQKTGKGKNQRLTLDYLDEDLKTTTFDSLEDFHKGKNNGKWRPFQLAFVLMNIESIIDPKSKEREIVDLIWFPTGGGKTEAYLGLTAFNIFFRRIKGKKESNWDYYGGTTVLMRYTLRLLTTQQYERAASLICACDLIRLENKIQREEELQFGELGEEPISIGLWVGGSSTPNKVSDARTDLYKLEKDAKQEYNFVVMKCPCCGTQIGKVDGANFNDTESNRTRGIHREDGKMGEVYFQCDNSSCEYSEIPLPLQVVDDSIYKNPPTLLLGTVDKFAMIPWKKEAGNLFGFRKEDSKNVHRICPPELIIQDELHLIAGPLGTMVGLYETMVQTLCNDYSKAKPPFISIDDNAFVAPKIIASSATISRAHDQVKNLYAKTPNQVSIFPAQGLSFGDTWFSEEKSLDELDDAGMQKYPGRRYVGILASGYPSAQTAIVRTYAMVLQRIKELSNLSKVESMDYYWTLLGYFNSIRELGGASSLVYGDVVERLSQIQSRDLIIKDEKRYLNRIEELTSRVSSSEIPVILKKLETKYSSGKTTALDICLATNMVATGVDISRLGLMFIHGQPKTTAEYIQASSRVGRRVPEGPGVIFTMYSPSKPRDKSHYEQFQGYHSRIYSNVEPTSVTPFSINAREKGLHAVLISLVRHFSAGSLWENPIITSDEYHKLTLIVEKLIKERCEIIDLDELSNTMKLLNKRIDSWKVGGAEKYGDAANSGILREEEFYPLMYASSAEVREDVKNRHTPFATSTSMRGVDSESILSVYSNSDNNE